MSCNSASCILTRLGLVASLALLCGLSSVSYAIESPFVGLSGVVEPAESGTSVVTDQYEFSQYSSQLFVFPAAGDFDLTGYMKHLVSVNTLYEDDFIHKVYGSTDLNASISVSQGMYNDFLGGATAGSSPCYDPSWMNSNTFTNDSWVGIGLTCTQSIAAGESDVTIEESVVNPWSDNFQVAAFENGNSGPVDISMDDSSNAGSWYLPSTTATNGFAGEDCKSVVMQITSEGSISWTLNAEIWVHGDENTKVILTQTYDGETMGSPIIEGCTDENACNYYDLATTDNGSCAFPDTYYDCADECLADADGDGVCDEFEIAGCQDALACNYNTAATDSDACIHPDGVCDSCSGEVDGSGSIVDNDSDDDGVCDEFEIAGCQDDQACNYNPEATDPANCIYRDVFFICDGDGSIQNAIDNASPADTIHVPAGTYIEALVIDKSIVLIANGEVILDVSGNTTGISILENTSLVTIEGFNIIGNDLTGSGITLNPGTSDISLRDNSISNILLPGGGNLSPLSYGILCWGNSNPVNPPTDILIENNEINGVLGSAVSLGSNSESITVRDNRFENIEPVAFAGSFLSVGVQAELANNLSISNNEFVGLLQSNNLVNCTGVTISSNTYELSALLLLTTFPHSTSFSDAPWWSTTLSLDGQSLSQAFFNTPLDPTYLYFASLEGFSQSSSNPGCNDDLACNYDLNALSNDGSCIYSDGICESCSGETDGTGSIVDNDSDDDGVCNADEILGCQDSTACNFNASATDAGACVYVDGICESCSGETDGTGSAVDNDSDDDGVCNADEIAGCQDSTACNYNASATDAGACVYVDGVCESCSGETDGTGSIVENDSDNDGVCDADEVVGCQDETACDYNSAATDAGDCAFPDGVCDTCSGETDGTGTIVDNDTDNDGVCDLNEVIGCQDATACNYNTAATDSADCDYPDGICETCSGETDGSGVTVDNDGDGDGVCNADEIQGCQDNTACNYNTAATDAGDCVYADDICQTCSGETDGSGTIVDNDADNDEICDLDEVAGCQDDTACNYNASATDGGVSCEYAIGPCAECAGSANDGTGFVLLNDADEDQVCDADEVPGCQNSDACNYNSAATDEDGSCIYATGCDSCSGATDGTGTVHTNYYDDDGDGVCNADEIPGCQDGLACNYKANATDPGVDCLYPTGCESCSGATDGTGVILANDADNDQICDADEVVGCMDLLACNYDASATDPGECYIAGEFYGCDGECLNDANGNGICDEIDELVSTADFNGYAEGYSDGLEAGLAQCIDGPIFCGEGTVWVESLQLCVEDSSCPGDLNGDDTVGTGDLLILLNDYGITCD